MGCRGSLRLISFFAPLRSLTENLGAGMGEIDLVPLVLSLALPASGMVDSSLSSLWWGILPAGVPVVTLCCLEVVEAFCLNPEKNQQAHLTAVALAVIKQ